MIKKRHSFFSFLAALLIVGSINLWVGTSHEMVVQADSIDQPTPINQIFPDSALAEVMRYQLGKSSVTDVVSQSELDNVTNVDGESKEIISIEGVQYLTNLTNLLLAENNIRDIQPLENLTNLTVLNMIDNELTDISPLSNLTNLTKLSLGDDSISDISPLAGLTNLINLYLTSYDLTDVSALANLTNLKDLWLSSPKLSNVSVLSNFHNLETLQLRSTLVSDITPIANLKKLTFLDVSMNEIKDISSLSELSNLTELTLTDNQISDISALADLSNLEELYVTDQTITNEPLTFQTNIVINNTIKDENGALVTPLDISDNGSYTSPNITWNLPAYTDEVNYTFEQTGSIGNGPFYFTGTVYQPLEEVPATYNVIFDIDGVQNSEEVVVDALLEEPAAPTKEGYTFTGWYDAKTGGEKWDFATDKMPAKDITLYAQFSINNYQAIFDVDGTTTSQTVNYQSLLTKPTDPTKEGYTFTGWYDAKTGGNKWDFSMDKMPANDITLYAQFSKNPENGGTDTPSNGNKTKPKQPARENGTTITAIEKSTTLPKTGDNGTALLVLAGLLLTGASLLLTKQKKKSI
ncbi:InlB B-repeat-containing protein [Listeria seeligeri]|uniref:InlB B-repeat-containing protein n=1 Tax=Listeria seeligeri TaxID=1640 RepID=UPI002892F654|nr:InlB B-repeat-containing protein [Listeria seeligeri]